MAYLDDVKIGATVTISCTNNETEFKKQFKTWYKDNGWSIREFHKGINHCRYTIFKNFPTEVAKNHGVNQLIAFVSRVNREEITIDGRDDFIDRVNRGEKLDLWQK